MAANKMGMKYRSITYPTHENIDDRNLTDKRSRGRLERMNSIDDGQCLAGGSQQQLQVSPFMYSSNKLQIPPASVSCNSRTASRRRDLSLEGHLRASQFKQTHSATSPLAPNKKLLRFSDGSLGKPSTSQSYGQNMRSTSCARLSRRGSPSSRASNTNLERLVDWQRPSFDRPCLSPTRSHERRQTPLSGKSQQKSRKLERFHSTDGQETLSSSKTSPGEPNQSASGSSGPTPGNSESRSRRSQFRRAMSLFSLSCDKATEKEKKAKPPPQKILRPPTRHIYRRGFSGLPIQCNSNNLGVVY